jgi:ATP-dependent Clp protease ATP-binding subunit ClpC
VLNIVDLELSRVRKQLQEHQLDLQITDEAKAWLAEKGYDPDFGARPLRRVIQNTIEDELAESLLSGRLKTGGRVSVTVADGEIKIEPLPPEPAAAEPEPALAGTAS